MSKIPVTHNIDDGVPIPVTRLSVPFRSLEVGQSVEFPLSKRSSIASMISRYKIESGKEFIISKTSKDTCRLWRVG